jgi:TfoX/Sxy family transcriptional regulator of competence genes
MAERSQSMSKSPWQKASPELVAFFLETMKILPGVETRKMFGYPCGFINGQMFCGLFENDMILRLPEEDRAIFRSLEGANTFEPMPGRRMNEYSVIPPAMLKAGDELKTWLVKSFNYAKSLPPKKHKK